MPFKKISWGDAVMVLVFSVIVLASIFYFREARGWIDKKFPGYLVFENNIVGAFNQFEWEGTKQGLKYHDPAPKDEPEFAQTFTLNDFLKVFCIPFMGGLFFAVSSLVIYSMIRGESGALPFSLFNLAIGYYFISSFDFHTNHHMSFLFLLNFALMPATMTHFALVYPEKPAFLVKHRFVWMTPYLLSFLLYLPYLYTFYKKPLLWPTTEGIVIGYAAFSYLFWIYRLMEISKTPQREASRIVAKYLLYGQGLAFLMPLLGAIYIFIFKGNIPLNWAVPATLVFPVASLFGITLGRLKKTQMQLIQSEKMASLGQLLAGVAHEINNPTTFIYSNLAPLRDYADYFEKIASGNTEKFRNTMSAGEVAGDLKLLVSNLEEGANRIKNIVSDLRRFGHSEETNISNVNLREGIESTLNILKHSWSDRIQIHLDVPNDLTLQVNTGQMSQIWMNLLTNAMDSIKEKGNIWITGKREKDKIIISVRDDGCGIEPKPLYKIFDPFFTTKEQGLGTGLGLSIVQQIVKRWGGEIHVKSEVGKGTEFRLSF